MREEFLFDLNRVPSGNSNGTLFRDNTEEEMEISGPQFDLNIPFGDTNKNLSNTDANQDPEDPISYHQPKAIRLSSTQRMQVLNDLLSFAVMGTLPKNTVHETAQKYKVSKRTITRIWKATKEQIDPSMWYNVNTKYQNCGRKRIQVDQQSIQQIHMGDRIYIRDLASKLSISKTICHRMINNGVMRPHTNALHPRLSEVHKKTRLEWILNLLKGDTLQTKTEYHPMYDFVHLDEKWFYLTKKSHRVYLSQHEKGLYRCASSSKFILKVMFTAVVAMPRFNENGDCTFDGKIGIFPFTYEEPAKRGSKSREKGTMVTKLIESVNQKVTRKILIEQIILAIKEKWPQDGRHKVIFIQQDNAKAHVTQGDKEWQQIYCHDNFTFILIQQPANSPDLNILDLGFFRSIQSLMHKKMPKDINDMLVAVNEAFYELDPRTLSDVWYSLQYVMNEILKYKGGNDYDLTHVNKRKLRKEGNLPIEVKAPNWTVRKAWNIVHGDAQVDEQPETQEATQVDTQAWGENEKTNQNEEQWNED